MNNDDMHQKIEYRSEVVESTGGLHRSALDPVIVELPNERKVMAITSLVLAIPFPAIIIFLWMTLGAIKGQGAVFSEAGMNAFVVYLLLFFVVPPLSLTSIILAFIVTTKASIVAKKLGYISLCVTVVGFIILGIFLNQG